ncbi:MAG TPA: lysylphosphatidylglycerol synthase transmembrane domain-containing protein [Streptosporangiaceae bacterium]
MTYPAAESLVEATLTAEATLPTGVTLPRATMSTEAVWWRRRGWWLKAGLLGAVVAGLLAWAPLADEDDLADVGAFVRSLVDGIESVRWQFVPLIAVLTALHYLFAGVALRAGAGGGLRMREVTLVQFAAAAANRLTPPGIGGAVVNARYLVRRRRPVSDAVGVVASVNLLGGLADGLLFLAVLAVTWASGTGALPVSAVGSRVHGLPAPPPHAVAAIAALAASLVVVWWLVRRRRARRGGLGAPGAAVAHSCAAAVRVLRRPRDLVTLLIASAGTTLVMAVAFAISVMAVPHGPPVDRFAVLLAAYLIGAAAGSAAPTPAGMGSTETALTAMLLAVNVGVAPAVQGVLLFRALTFWAPVPIGVVAAGQLRRRSAL